MAVRLLASCTVAGGESGFALEDMDGAVLEAAFAAIQPDLIALAGTLARETSAFLAHTPSAAVNCSDLGLMMAWSHLVKTWAADDNQSLTVCCTDPWLFRHLAQMPGVTAGRPPGLVAAAGLLVLRGMAARAAYAVKTAYRAVTTRKPRDAGCRKEGAWLLSYAHPASTSGGADGYFGDLMHWFPGLGRVLHVDCGRSSIAPALTAWGSPWAALRLLPFARWQPSRPQRRGCWGWLVRRAAAMENSTAQGAAIAWQSHCQRRWLAQTRPAVIAWPWENHGWERDLVRACRSLNIRTVGYQHASVGRTELNYHPGTNADGADGLPDAVLCVGASAADYLAAWGVPRNRLAVGGGLRYGACRQPAFDPVAPLFVALPADLALARQMLDAVNRAVPDLGREVLVRPHPIYSLDIPETALIKRAQAGLEAQPAVSAVLYAATTVGLEAVLAGLPTIRFIPRGCVALDILPNTIELPAADEAGLAAAIQAVRPPPPLRREEVFASVDIAVWRKAFDGLPLESA